MLRSNVVISAWFHRLRSLEGSFKTFPRSSMNIPPETNRLSKSSTLTRVVLRRLPHGWRLYTDYSLSIPKGMGGKMYAFGLESVEQLLTSLLFPAGRKSCSFWIKSSARRAFGECLGSKRRWRTWYSAISHVEPRIGFDTWITEWGNPPDYILLLSSFG